MVKANHDIDLDKLHALGQLVYNGGGDELVEKVRQVNAPARSSNSDLPSAFRFPTAFSVFLLSVSSVPLWFVKMFAWTSPSPSAGSP
jgi:hypothetical protein